MTTVATRPGRSAPPAAADGSRPLLDVEDLRVGFDRHGHRTDVVRGVSFSLGRGRCLAVVGESGSGKSVTARTLVGLAGAGAHVEATRLELAGRDLTGLKERQWRRIRGREVGVVLQDALVSLDQFRTVGAEVSEPLRVHGWRDRRARADRVLRTLGDVGIPDPAVRVRQRPYELSGGLRQRALIASAMVLEPELLIADEPTTALDVTVQAQVLDLLAAAKNTGKAVLLISHDLAVVAQLADEICVMKDGVIVEAGPADRVLHEPEHPYTRSLIAAVPSARTRGTRLSRAAPSAIRTDVRARPAPPPDAPPLLEARDLIKRFRAPDRTWRTVVDGVSFRLERGRTLGVVGESGSGKTTTARIALALTAPDHGEVRLDGEPWSALTAGRRRPNRHRVGVVYQDPLSSFDPRWSVGQILTDALRAGPRPPADRRRRAAELLDLVSLPSSTLDRAPLRLSGGQRQRVAIARALAHDPDVIVCDEPVSALDVSVQAQVLDLLGDLQDALGLAYLFISHDLGVVRHISHDVAVMSDGRVVEQGPAGDVLGAPQHPCTQSLLTALPELATRPPDLTTPASEPPKELVS